MKNFLLCFALILGVFSMNAQLIGIVGPAANGWPADGSPPPDIMLTDNGDNTHTIDGLTLTTGPAKFRENQMWGAGEWGGDTFPAGAVTSGNIPVQAGIYDIVLDLNTNTYTFTNVSTFTEIELAGSALSSSVEMSTIDGENYELTVTQFGAGDILLQEVGTSNTFGSNSFPTGTATSGGTAIPVQAGFYEVVFNLTTGDYAFSIPVVGIVGPAANGWPDDSNPTDIPMTSSDGDVYSLNSQALNDGELKFRQNLNWDVNWGGTDFPSGSAVFNTSNNIPATAGTYDISFFRANLTYTFTSLSVEDLSFENFKLYPNPTQDSWTFENPSKAIESISIYDTFGKLVHEVKPNSSKGYVSAQTFAEGLYLAKVRLIDNTETTVKIIKR